tara:strand:- start:4823 stop:5275 length:453 start_codon:yes stop_codon:yes gene_type:complete
MTKYLIVLMLYFFSIGLAQEEKKARPKRYTGVGLFDHKTGLSIFGNTWALYQTNQHEIFAGLGIMPAGTLSLGWKYYMNEGPIEYYSVISVQQINAMGGEVVAPYLSIGGEKKITKKLYLNLGISTVVRLYSDLNTNIVPFPAMNISWRK